jgi:hypothetical protein
MTGMQGKAEVIALKGLLERNQDFVRSAVPCFGQAALEAEMTETRSAENGGREPKGGFSIAAALTRGR